MLFETDYVTKDIALKIKDLGYNPMSCFDYCYAYETEINPEVQEKYDPEDTFTDSDYYELTKEGGGELDWEYVYTKQWVFREKNFFGEEVPAPTYFEVMRWLREYNIYIMIDRSFSVGDGWHYVIVIDNDFENQIQQPVKANRTWEVALSDAVEKCLGILEEKLMF